MFGQGRLAIATYPYCPCPRICGSKVKHTNKTTKPAFWLFQHSIENYWDFVKLTDSSTLLAVLSGATPFSEGKKVFVLQTLLLHWWDYLEFLRTLVGKGNIGIEVVSSKVFHLDLCTYLWRGSMVAPNFLNLVLQICFQYQSTFHTLKIHALWWWNRQGWGYCLLLDTWNYFQLLCQVPLVIQAISLRTYSILP